MDFVGSWHIFEVEIQDGKYYDIETSAYIEIDFNNQGEFRFRSVTGCIDGRLTDNVKGKNVLEFTWEGSDESYPLSGSGWVWVKEPNVLEGEFRIHLGDHFKFLARRVEQKSLNSDATDTYKKCNNP